MEQTVDNRPVDRKTVEQKIAEQVTFRPGPPRILNPDPPTIEKFYQLGRQGASYRVCGKAFGCSKDTIGNFLHRYPQVMAVYQAGLGEYRAQVLLEKQAATEAKRAAAGEGADGAPPARMRRPKRGETCPLCGQTAVDGEEQIVLTQATIAEARRRIDALIARQVHASDTRGDREG